MFYQVATILWFLRVIMVHPPLKVTSNRKSFQHRWTCWILVDQCKKRRWPSLQPESRVSQILMNPRCLMIFDEIYTHIYIYDYTYTGYNVSIYTWTYTTFVHLKKVANSWPTSLGPTTITCVCIKISLSVSLSLYIDVSAHVFLGSMFLYPFAARSPWWTWVKTKRMKTRTFGTRSPFGRWLSLLSLHTRVECMSALNMDLVVVALPTQTK